MCRGLALGYNRKTGEIICKGLSSHTDTLNEEDNFVKLEIICDDRNKDGYKIIADEDYSKEDKEFFNTKGELKKPFYDIIYKWVKDNELQVLRWLLVNRTHTEAGRDLNQSWCEAGRDLNQSSCEAGENLGQSFCKAGRDLDQSFCKAGEDLDQSSCEAGNILYNHRCKAKKMTIQYMECGTKKQNEFIKMLSDNAKNNILYWSDLVNLAMKGYKK